MPPLWSANQGLLDEALDHYTTLDRALRDASLDHFGLKTINPVGHERREKRPKRKEKER
jgi:hypothetical protein